MLLLAAVALLMLFNTIPSMETPSWGLAVGTSLVLIWKRSAQLAVPRALLNLLAFPFLMLFVCLHGVYTHSLATAGKDCWYFTLPLAYMTFGFLAYERAGSWQRLMQPLILFGMGTALFAIVHAVLNRGQLADAATVDQYRGVTGGGTFGPMVPMMILLIARRAGLKEYGLERWKWLRVLAYVSATGAVLITFSRTHMVTLLLGVLCAISYRSALRRVLGSGGLPLIGLLLVLAGGGFAVSRAKSGPVELFLKKVANSGSEVQVRAYETFEQINNNWRGYEAYRATKTYARFSLPDKIFGGGAGSMVDLGFAMQLSPTEFFQYVPITHNGYMYILIKDGICGLCLFALFVLQLLWTGRRALRLGDPVATFSGLMLIWTAMVIVATQGVITGIYNKGELIPILFLTGASAGSYAQRKRAREDAGYELMWQAARVNALPMPPGAIAAGEGAL